MRRGGPKPFEEMLSFALLIIGIVVIGVILILIVRVQRGWLGVILAGLAAVLLAYWLKETRKTIREELAPTSYIKSKKWIHEVIDAEAEVTVVAEVPGPEEKVKVKLMGNTLEISGGHNYEKIIELPGRAEIVKTTYVNNVLNVRLRKLQ